MLEDQQQADSSPGQALGLPRLILVKGDIIGYDLNQDGYVEHVAVYLGEGRAAAHSESWKGHWHLGYSSSDFDPTFVHITKKVGPEIPWNLLAVVGAALTAILGWQFLL